MHHDSRGPRPAAVIHRKWPFDEKPLLIFWETTKACMLACKHCRASAILEPLPGELSHEEGIKLIDDIAGFGKPSPILVFTGGDPLMRKDIWSLVARAKEHDITVAMAPAITPKLTDAEIRKMVEMGVSGISISLDGSRPEIHDSIRGVSGVFKRSIEIIRSMLDSGLRVQVNTAVMRDNVEDLADIVKLLIDLGVRVWEVFYLIPVGRAQKELDLSPKEWEDVSHFLYEASKYGIVVRTSEGPMFRRVAVMRRLLELHGYDPDEILKPGPLYHRLVSRLRSLLGEPKGKPLASTTGTRDGKGILFISHDGLVYPSGFMPYPVGNVRKESIVKIYRENELLRKIRAAEFEGKCGICEFRDICGGSRARAYTLLGDPLAEDPACPYNPGEFTRLVEKLGLDTDKAIKDIEGLKYVLPPKPDASKP
ncbi:Radical SAM domain containing protein [Pyrodictium delaneyi]|uniref:Radical SAM domain containing protein n=1 Tax=Pyrodictium delaneyi TaxID=1273541 RepID=A0A0P0N1Z8_9CREN|nr:TIGR04053 family radical SAM/SPASM domain-containing protein [Pyrodictium delaneyi]ALL00623.1 Radical SAM domain containing protein [Pyrodictium delaneyi]OWJ54202.1 radical SAM/SPASM domain-containing protein [Pyrodictium delaneyi]